MKHFERLCRRVTRGFHRIHSDESGQSLVFAVITLMIVTFFAGSIYRVGFASSSRIKAQNAADATAISMALTEANALSALAWINEGMAAIHYQMMRYAVDVIIAAVDLEFVDPGPRRPGATLADQAHTSQELIAEIGPAAYDASAARSAYDDAYARAQEEIPKGKQYLHYLSQLQKQILERVPENILRAGLHTHRATDVTDAAEGLGAAFAMSKDDIDPNDSDGRGVQWASVFPDVEELVENYNPDDILIESRDTPYLPEGVSDSTSFFKYEVDCYRFGLEWGAALAMGPDQLAISDAYGRHPSTVPNWTAWFDAGVRGMNPGWPRMGNRYSFWYHGQGFRFWDVQRTYTEDKGWNGVGRHSYYAQRTFARIGRLYYPDYHGRHKWPRAHITARDTRDRNHWMTRTPYGPNQRPELLGGGYKAGEDLTPAECWIRVSNIRVFWDESGDGGRPRDDTNQFLTPFVVRFNPPRVVGATGRWTATQSQDGDEDADNLVELLVHQVEEENARDEFDRPQGAGKFYVKAIKGWAPQPVGEGEEQTWQFTVEDGLPFEMWIWARLPVGQRCYHQPCQDPDGNDVDCGCPASNFPGCREWCWGGHGGCGCVEKHRTGTNCDYYSCYRPGLQYGRYLVLTIGGQKELRFHPISLKYAEPDCAYYQTRGPCWNENEILESIEPELDGATGEYVSKVVQGATGYVFDEASGNVSLCPTCGTIANDGDAAPTYAGIDQDGDRKVDVRLYPWHTFHRQGTLNLDEVDYMDCRVFRELDEFGEVAKYTELGEPDGFTRGVNRLAPNDPGSSYGDVVADQNWAYGIEPVDPPIVLREEFFKWGRNVGVWMRPAAEQLILPASWEPQWGYFAIASARAAVFTAEHNSRGGYNAGSGQYHTGHYDPVHSVWELEIDEEHPPQSPNAHDWVTDFALYDDPLAVRLGFIRCGANLYQSDWQARLVHTGRTIRDEEAAEEDALYQSGFHMLLDKLVTNPARNYDVAGPLGSMYSNVIQAIVNGQPAPTGYESEIATRLQELFPAGGVPTDTNHHALNPNDPELPKKVHH